MIFDDANELIKAIRSNNHYDCNNWESDFIDSIEEQIRVGTKLTTRQFSKLQDLYRKCYGG